MAAIKIISLNTSEKNGNIKIPGLSVEINELGIIGDSHAGKWHRQVSLLGTESYKKVKDENNLELKYGSFAENITTEGMILHNSNVLDRFVADDVVLEVTQIGKKCHSGCDIQKQIGNCVMPEEGIFCRVLQGGILKTGAAIEYRPKEIKVHVMTMSDRAYSGDYSDRSGPRIGEMMSSFLEDTGRRFLIDYTIVPDRRSDIESAFMKAVNAEPDILITTGGTGIGPKDITPDVIKPMLDKEISGIMELIRVKYGMEKPNALISRSIAGVFGSTLVYVLPGSVKAINEYMSEIIPTLEHSMRMIHGIDSH